eukprot:UN29965
MDKEYNIPIIEVTRDNGKIIILDPDTLVIPTRIAGSFPCIRSPIIADKHRKYEQKKVLLWGTMTHDLFELSLHRGHFDKNLILEDMENIIRNYIVDLYSIDETEGHATTHMKSFLITMEKWFKTFVNSGKINQRNQLTFGSQRQRENIQIQSVLDTEQNVWSTMFGLRGNIDGTMRVTHT